MILAFDRQRAAWPPGRAVSSLPRGCHPPGNLGALPCPGSWLSGDMPETRTKSSRHGIRDFILTDGWGSPASCAGRSGGSTECPSSPGRQSSSGMQAPRRGDRNQTARGFTTSPRRGPPDDLRVQRWRAATGARVSTITRSGSTSPARRNEAMAWTSGERGVQAPARWRGGEVDDGRAGQFRVGDGRARSDADGGHQSSAYLREGGCNAPERYRARSVRAYGRWVTSG